MHWLKVQRNHKEEKFKDFGIQSFLDTVKCVNLPSFFLSSVKWTFNKGLLIPNNEQTSRSFVCMQQKNSIPNLYLHGALPFIKHFVFMSNLYFFLFKKETLQKYSHKHNSVRDTKVWFVLLERGWILTLPMSHHIYIIYTALHPQFCL